MRLTSKQNWSRSSAIAVLIAAGVLSGCNSSKQSGDLSAIVGQKADTTVSDTVDISALRPAKEDVKAQTVLTENKKIAFKKSNLKSSYAVDAKSVGAITRAHDIERPHLQESFRWRTKYHRETQRIADTVSAHCRRLLAQAGVETTILRSPTINGSINTDQDFSFGASFDFVDLTRANLKEELALAKCVRDAAAVRLAQLLVTSNQALTRAGYLAKSRSLKRSNARLNRIKRLIRQGLYNGDLTQTAATALRQYVEHVRSRQSAAEGEAARRQVIDRIQKQNFKNLDRELLRAERRIQDIERRSRTADAIKVQASIGYAQRGPESIDRSIAREGSVTGKIAVSFRLGAAYSRRSELEDIAEDARIAEYYERDSGALWRTGQMAQANKFILRSMKRQRRDLLAALAQAKRNARHTASEFEPELLRQQIHAKVNVIALQADLAGLDATIADTRRVDGKLKFLR